MSPQTDTPPLAALYEELHSALIAVASLHRAIARHPATGPRIAHEIAAVNANANALRFCGHLSGETRHE